MKKLVKLKQNSPHVRPPNTNIRTEKYKSVYIQNKQFPSIATQYQLCLPAQIQNSSSHVNYVRYFILGYLHGKLNRDYMLRKTQHIRKPVIILTKQVLFPPRSQLSALVYFFLLGVLSTVCNISFWLHPTTCLTPFANTFIPLCLKVALNRSQQNSFYPQGLVLNLFIQTLMQLLPSLGQR